MTAIVRDWRIDLMKAHDGLFHPPAGAPESAKGYPNCGDGWRELLERTLFKIEAALAEGGGTFSALRIKEKYGTLRFCWNGGLSDKAKAKDHEAIDLAEARSACTCEQCGEEGCLYRAGGALMTRCAAHAKGEPLGGQARLGEPPPCAADRAWRGQDHQLPPLRPRDRHLRRRLTRIFGNRGVAAWQSFAAA